MENLLAPGEGQSFDPAKFKLLLQHRKLEAGLAAGRPPGQPGLPFMPGFNPAMFGLPNSGTRHDLDSLFLILFPILNLFWIPIP